MVASGCTLLLERSTAALAHKNDETESMGPPTRLAHVSTPRHNYFQCDLSGGSRFRATFDQGSKSRQAMRGSVFETSYVPNGCRDSLP